MARRFIVMGAGAIGAGLGGRLVDSGASVTFVARGAHGEALKQSGLQLAEPAGTRTIALDVHLGTDRLQVSEGDVVLLCVKSQHTEAALAQLDLPRTTPVVCVQNGVQNEVLALGHVDRVLGCMAWVPGTLLVPGRVEIHGTPPGMLMFGAWPGGDDPLAAELAAAFAGAGFVTEAVQDIRRFKYTKLLTNLLGTAQAVCGADADLSSVRARVMAEGEAALRAAGIDFAPLPALLGRTAVVKNGAIDGAPRVGGSTWQSAARGTGSIETEHLNGEIVRLGEAHGADVTVNRRLCEAAQRGPEQGWGTVKVEALLQA